MTESVFYIVLALILFIVELLYFRIADHYNIIDKPNHRSSHTTVTIRGGGVIFPLAVLIWFLYSGLTYPMFFAGLMLISFISFLDDVVELKSLTRSFFQFIAVGLLLAEVQPLIPWFYYPILFVLIVGTKNAYNFMDGINGITALYSLVSLCSFWYINRFVDPFTSGSLLAICILSVLVFNYFNCRGKARCFAGDVGSVSMAFIVLFLLMQLIIKTENLIYILFLLVYGLDTVTTIFFRLIRKENIFEAHRTHFYQFLANERKWPHLEVSAVYAVVQLAVNAFCLAIFSELKSPFNFLPLMLLIVLSALCFFILRFMYEGKDRLMLR